MNEKILTLLRGHQGYISGEELSHKLGISRAAIWKHMQELRELGYEIEAVPHLGYALRNSPDKLFAHEIAAGLGTRTIGKQVYFFGSVVSTMDTAFTYALQGAAEGTLVCADAQQKGRGRLGRSWVSVRGKGIYCSLIVRPNISPVEAPSLTLLAAVATAQAIKKTTRLDCRIKWPNDLLIEGKKVGGILTEMNAEMDRVRFVVIGVGLNVNTPESSLPQAATSLKLHLSDAVNRVALTQEILRTFEDEYQLFLKHGCKRTIEQWRKFSTTIGHRVKVSSHHHHIEGEALDIDTDGGLLIRRDSGFVEKVLVGDVVKVR